MDEWISHYKLVLFLSVKSSIVEMISFNLRDVVWCERVSAHNEDLMRTVVHRKGEKLGW